MNGQMSETVLETDVAFKEFLDGKTTIYYC